VRCWKRTGWFFAHHAYLGFRTSSYEELPRILRERSTLGIRGDVNVAPGDCLTINVHRYAARPSFVRPSLKWLGRIADISRVSHITQTRRSSVDTPRRIEEMNPCLYIHIYHIYAGPPRGVPSAPSESPSGTDSVGRTPRSVLHPCGGDKSQCCLLRCSRINHSYLVRTLSALVQQWFPRTVAHHSCASSSGRRPSVYGISGGNSLGS
jgi:hypothetical protein